MKLPLGYVHTIYREDADSEISAGTNTRHRSEKLNNANTMNKTGADSESDAETCTKDKIRKTR